MAALNKAMNEATDDFDRHVFVFEYSSVKIPKGEQSPADVIASPESPSKKKPLNPLMIKDVNDRPVITVQPTSDMFLDRPAGWFDARQNQAVLNAKMNAAVDIPGDKPNRFSFVNKYSGLPQQVEYSDLMECQSSFKKVETVRLDKTAISKIFKKQ